MRLIKPRFWPVIKLSGSCQAQRCLWGRVRSGAGRSEGQGKQIKTRVLLYLTEQNVISFMLH